MLSIIKLKYFLAWLPGTIIAIVNGTLRQFVYRLYLGELQAHQLSVLSFIFLFGIYLWLILPWLKLSSFFEAISVGVFWLIITIAFEFLFGHFIMRHSWQNLFYDYNLLKGRFWILVLVWVAISPYLLFRLKNSVGKLK